MTVRDLIKKLMDFDLDLEVCITDGWETKSYMGDFEICEFDGTVDIGVGGMNVAEEKGEIVRVYT